MLKNYYKKLFMVKLCFTICEIIFGIHLEHDTIINFINYKTMPGKWYVNNCRMNAKTIHIIKFQAIVRSKLKILHTLKVKVGVLRPSQGHIGTGPQPCHLLLTLNLSHEKETMYKLIN